MTTITIIILVICIILIVLCIYGKIIRKKEMEKVPSSAIYCGAAKYIEDRKRLSSNGFMYITPTQLVFNCDIKDDIIIEAEKILSAHRDNNSMNGIEITLKDGETYLFKVNSRNKWVEHISQQLTTKEVGL